MTAELIYQGRGRVKTNKIIGLLKMNQKSFTGKQLTEQRVSLFLELRTLEKSEETN